MGQPAPNSWESATTSWHQSKDKLPKMFEAGFLEEKDGVFHITKKVSEILMSWVVFAIDCRPRWTILQQQEPNFTH
jgi:hypothetical protein